MNWKVSSLNMCVNVFVFMFVSYCYVEKFIIRTSKCLPAIYNFCSLEDACILHAKQPHKYRQALLETGNDRLCYNIENDPWWGFGKDGTGLDKMGKISENARAIIKSLAEATHSDVATDIHTKQENEMITEMICVKFV